MWYRLIEFVTFRLESIQDQYFVNPYVFLILLVVCSPLFYFSIYRIVKATVHHEGVALLRWGAIFLSATSTPYVYILIFGRNMPWWVYVIFGLLIAQGILALGRKIKGARKDQ